MEMGIRRIEIAIIMVNIIGIVTKAIAAIITDHQKSKLNFLQAGMEINLRLMERGSIL